MTLGKFLASMIFYVSALAGTLVLPLMLVLLGSPDLGPIFGAYLGSLLLGAFFLSLGLFISAMCRDQIVAFMLTLLGCFGFYLAGTEFVATLAEAAWPGLGSLLAEAVGVTQHYLTFTRGLLVLGDVLYFLVWTVVWLVLNSLFLGIRNRPVARNGFMAALALCLSVGLTTNWLLAEQNLGRIDLTEDELYTLSPASGRILKQLPDPVQVSLYITPRQQLPVTMRYLERDVRDQSGRHAPGQRRQLADAGGASANGGRDPEGEPGVAAARPGRSRRATAPPGAGGAAVFGAGARGRRHRQQAHLCRHRRVLPGQARGRHPAGPARRPGNPGIPDHEPGRQIEPRLPAAGGSGGAAGRAAPAGIHARALCPDGPVAAGVRGPLHRAGAPAVKRALRGAPPRIPRRRDSPRSEHRGRHPSAPPLRRQPAAAARGAVPGQVGVRGRAAVPLELHPGAARRVHHAGTRNTRRSTTGYSSTG